MDSDSHIPVMLSGVLDALAPRDGQVYLDGTFGAGGYTRAILDAANCTVIAIDRDRSALDRAASWQASYGGRLILRHGCFGDMRALAAAAGYPQVDGVVLDIGVSSMQIDQAERGFSFRFDGPLDMRMDADSGVTAADIVNGYAEQDLANLIYEYGEERNSRRIARAIVQARAETKLARTLELAAIVRKAQPRKPNDKIDPATRTFQALRIAVNDELGELRGALAASEQLLREDGRLVVVTFHSLEDGIVKRFLAERSGRQDSGSRHLPVAVEAPLPATFISRGKPAAASPEEAASNPRARSAKLRVGIRSAAPARTQEAA